MVTEMLVKIHSSSHMKSLDTRVIHNQCVVITKELTENGNLAVTTIGGLLLRKPRFRALCLENSHAKIPMPSVQVPRTLIKKLRVKRTLVFTVIVTRVQFREYTIKKLGIQTWQIFSNLKGDFCAISDNVFKNPGGGTCLEQNAAKDLAKEYCSVGARITGKGDGVACTKDNLDNYYNELAEAYCKGAGKSKEWCSCYNVTHGVCDRDSAAAGCDKKRRGFDKLVEGTPSEFKTQWNGMEGCFEGVCQGAKYVPENANQNCDRPVQICVQDFDFNSISGGSTINATCNQNAGTGTSVGDGSSGSPSYTPSGAPSGTTYPSGSVSEKLDTSFRSKLPKSVLPFIPVSFDEVKTDSHKMIGVGSSGFSSIISIVLIIVLLVASSSGGGGGPMRFRR